MDPPGGGPGPPRPAPSPVQNIAPTPQEGPIPIFPFNAAQQQTPLALQIGHGAASIPIANPGSSPFEASEPFGNNAFLAAIPGRPGTDANPLNHAQNINSATTMVQNVNQAGANSQPRPMPSNQPRQATPQQVSHQTSRDLFGELEKALSVSGPPQNAADFDVLDHAIAGGSQQPSPPQQTPIVSNAMTSQPQQRQGIRQWPQSQSQSQDSHGQRAVQIHQSHLQSQLQQQQQQQQIRQRHLQQQAHIAQQQQLRQQHFQHQQIRQQQLRQQQQFGQLRHLQPQPQQPNAALVNQAHQQSQSQSHQATQLQTQSQQQQPTLQLAQQAQQRRTQPMHPYPPKHIQPAVILPVQGQGNVPYPAGLVGQSNIGSSGQMQNALGSIGVTSVGQSAAIGSAAQQAATTPAVLPSKSKTKSKKQSQRRPRARSQAKNLQARSSQSQSPSASQSSGQQGHHAARVSQLGRSTSPEQMRVFAAQQQYISPPQHMQPSPLPMQRTPQLPQQSRKHELQTRLLQQRQVPHQTNHVQPSVAPMGSSSFVPNATFAPSAARSSTPHRGANVHPGKSLPFGAQQMSQVSGSSAGLRPNQLPQLPANELASIAKFDRATLQKLLSRTTDPKLYAALQQQLQILHGNASGQILNSSHPPRQNAVHIQPQGQVLQQGSAASPVSQVHPRSSGQHGIATSALPSSQGSLPNQQQLVKQQQGYHQQPPQQLHNPQRPVAVGQQQGAAQIFPRGVAYRHQSLQQSLGVINPHASQSVASLPQHVQHQIQADIQAQHIQAQLQSQSKLSSQRNSGVAPPGSIPPQSQNIPTVLPRRSLSPSESHKTRKSPNSSKQNVMVSQANGAVANHLTSRTNVKPSMPLTISGPQPSSGVGQFSQQPHMSSSVLQPQGPGTSAALPQAVWNVAENQSAQLAQSTSRNAAARRIVESKKLVAERKRLAREAELKEIAAQKKRRLETAPSSDYRGVLAPDCKTPFAGQVNAWQRLVPFHVLLSKDREPVSSEDWNAEVTKLCEKYGEGFRDLREKVMTLPDRESNFVADQIPGLGEFVLSNDDCIVMETVILEDVYETARQEKALQESKAREMARRRAIEMEAARRAAEQAAVAIAAATEASMRSERERKSRAESERLRAMPSGGMYLQGSPGNDQSTALPSVISGRRQIFGAPQPAGAVNNNASIGTPNQVPVQAGNGQAYQNHIGGFAPTGGMLMYASDGGQSRPVYTAQSSRAQVVSDGADRRAINRNTASGISQALQQAHQAGIPQAHQAGIPHIQVQGYQSSAQRESQQVAAGIQNQQNMAVRSNTPVSSQAWVGHEMLTANMQSAGRNSSSRALGGHMSNGMNLSVGSGTQTSINGSPGGIGPHVKKVLNSKNELLATSSQQSHVSHERPVPYRTGRPPERGTSSATLGPRGQPDKTSVGAVVPIQGSISDSRGFGVTSMGLSTARRPAGTNHIGTAHTNRGGASNHIVGGQLPNYPGSMQGQGTPTTVPASSLAQAGPISGGSGMNPLQQGTDPMRYVHSSSHMPLAMKPSPTHPYATPAAAPNAAGQAVGPNGSRQHGGKERRSMGMGSLLNADRS